MNRYTQYGVLLTAAIAVVAAFVFPSVINLWYVIGTLFIPALLLPLISAYYPRLRISSTLTFLSMSAGLTISAVWFLWGQLSAAGDIPAYPLGIEPMYSGLTVTVLIYAIAKKYPGVPAGAES